MSKILMTKEERKIIDAVLNGFYNLFWEYGDKEACFKEDVEMERMMVGIDESH